MLAAQAAGTGEQANGQLAWSENTTISAPQ